MTSKAITIAAVPYSDNLGDAVIFECLRFVVERRGYAVVPLDLSYRTGVTSRKAKSGWRFHSYLALPRFIRRLCIVLWWLVKSLRGGNRYLVERTSQSVLTLVGGGQLISDVDANFPIKLYLLTRVLERLNKQALLMSVGVGKEWSLIGRLLMRRALTSKCVVGASVRDEQSARRLAGLFDVTATVLPDPALLSSLVWARPSRRKGQLLLLGVADPSTLQHSSGARLAMSGLSTAIANTVRVARDHGHQVGLFTNGAAEDELYLHTRLLTSLVELKESVAVIPAPKSASELVATIQTADVMVAFRLHALIVASSYGIPCQGVAWDSKVRAFMEQVGAPDRAHSTLESLNQSLGPWLADPQAPQTNPGLLLQAYEDWIGHFG